MSLFQTTGIILKNQYPYNFSLYVLTQELGKIKLYVPERKAQQFHVGSIVSLSIKSYQNRYHLQDFDVLYIPFFQLERLRVILQMLQLCYYLLPEAMQSSHVYLHILGAYKYDDQTFTKQYKILQLKLFLLLDVFPDNSALYHRVLHYNEQLSEQKIEKALAYCWEKYHDTIKDSKK